MSSCSSSSCSTCSGQTSLRPLGASSSGASHVVALAGNPNVGKSTVFNRLTGLRQHTGNWPGKTIARAEGHFLYAGESYKLVDLPGTYSLLSASPDEEVARDFLLFGKPDVTVVVLDTTALERNLHLTLQILQITDRVVLCLNLMDEARARGITVDVEGLSRTLGVPVVPCSARSGEGFENLLTAIRDVAHGAVIGQASPPWPQGMEGIQEVVDELAQALDETLPGLPHREWVSLRLLEGDESLRTALVAGDLGRLRRDHAAASVSPSNSSEPMAETLQKCRALLEKVNTLQWKMPPNSHDLITEHLYAESARLCAAHVRKAPRTSRWQWQKQADRWLTHPLTGFPLMFLIFAGVLWITIEGSNRPSGILESLLVETFHPLLREAFNAVGAPWWLTGILVDGVYLATAWVVSVMLPPMAIFFPLFTILEDLGYLPRVAFNLDRIFQAVGAHGKQALTMSMGLGCNAAGVVACRVIDSPRERLIAILTNNFSLCNGRWPAQILLATIFLGALVPPAAAGVVATLAVAGVALLGFALAFLTSWLLSRSVLKGQASAFSLELPPYRPSNVLRTLYSSLIDRTLFVLWRAMVFAAPAGAVIWMIGNISVGSAPLASLVAASLEPLGWLMGLSGLSLLAYIIAIPANEIVIPTILMLTVTISGSSAMGAGAGVIFEAESNIVRDLLVSSGWTTLTAVCLMVFSLCHNPCSTTLYTIYKETGSWKWTLLAAAIPLSYGFFLCSLIAFVWRAIAGS